MLRIRSSRGGVLEVHFRRIAAVPFVALDRAGQPPALVGGRGQQAWPSSVSAARKAISLNDLPSSPQAIAADMAVADDADP
jgi:outer membrane receptor protein involved in Fe transport